MDAPKLEKMLLNKCGKYYSLFTYKNEWDPEKKRSKRVPLSSKKAGQIAVPGNKVGQVIWEPWFIELHPELAKMDTERLDKGKFRFTLKEDPELDADQTKILIKEAMKLKRQSVGAAWALENLIAGTPMAEALHRVFSPYKVDLKILSLAFFLVLEQNNSMTHYEIFARETKLPWNVPLTDSAITRIFQNITPDKIDNYLKTLNKIILEQEEANSNFKPKYWAFDSTSISTYSKNQIHAAWGKNKEGDQLKQVNILMVVDQTTGCPLYYRTYNGNIPDVMTVKHMLQESCRIKLDTNAVYVADRGYGSVTNIHRFLQCSLNFLLNVSTRLSMCKTLFAQNLQLLTDPMTFNPTIGNNHCVTCEMMWSYPVNFTTNCKHRPPREKAPVFVHLYFNPEIKLSAENVLKNNIFTTIEAIQTGQELNDELKEFRDTYLIFDKEKKEWKTNMKAYHEQLLLKGLRVLVSNTVKDPVEAYRAYYDRSQCEQAFNQYKDTLGFNRLRSCDDRSLRGRQFVQFIAASIGIMFRKRMVAAEAKGFKSGYDSDAKLLRALGTIHSTIFEGGTYYTEVTSKLAAAYKALEMPIPEDVPSTGTAAPWQAADEELNTVEDLVDLTKLSVDDIDDLLQ